MTFQELQQQISVLAKKQKATEEEWELLHIEEEAYQTIIKFSATNNIELNGYDFQQLASFEDNKDGLGWYATIIELHREFYLGIRSEPKLLNDAFISFESHFYKQHELRQNWQ